MAGQYIEEARNKYISALVVANKVEEIALVAEKDIYAPISREVSVHKEGVPNLTDEINMTIEQVTIDLDTLDKEIGSAALNLKAFFDSVKLSFDSSRARLEKLKQKKDDADLLSFRYSDFATVIDLDSSKFTGSFTADGSMVSAYITEEIQEDVSIENVEGNGYEGNSYVLADGAYLKDTVDTSARTNMTDGSLSTVYEYSRITASANEKIRCEDVHTDTSEALCFVTVKSQEKIQAIVLCSDLRFKMNSLFASDDGVNFTKLDYDFDSVIGNTLVFPSTNYVKLGIESYGCTNDILAFNADLVEGYDFTMDSITSAEAQNATRMLVDTMGYINIPLRYDMQYKEINKNSINGANISMTDISTGKAINLDGRVSLQKLAKTSSYLTLPASIIVNNTTIKLTNRITFPQKYSFGDFEVEVLKDGGAYKIVTTNQFINVDFAEDLDQYSKYKISISNVVHSDGTKSQINGDIYINTLSENKTLAGSKKEVPVSSPVVYDLGITLNEAYASGDYIFMTDEAGYVVKTSVSLGADNQTVTVTPSSTLDYNSKYRLTVSGGAKLASGNLLGASKYFDVTTKSSACTELSAAEADGLSASIEIPLLIQYDSEKVYVIDGNNSVVDCDIEIDGNTAEITFSETESGRMFVVNGGALNLQGMPIGTTYYCKIE